MTKAPLTADIAYKVLHKRISDGEVKPGERLREAAIAEEFQLSRTPVREALRRLETEGLVVHQPHKGMVVRKLDHRAVTELYLMREVLEGTAAGLASRHASDAEVETLFAMIAEQEDKHGDGNGDGREAARLNKNFHRALYLGAHNRYLMQMLDGLSTSMALLGRTTLSLPERQQKAVAEHRAIVEAIAAHDPEGAEKAARAHIHEAHKARLRILFEDEEEDET
ncbi:MAG: GntR family transcriptional regulator [Pseudomonadota bacterium]